MRFLYEEKMKEQRKGKEEERGSGMGKVKEKDKIEKGGFSN